MAVSSYSFYGEFVPLCPAAPFDASVAAAPSAASSASAAPYVSPAVTAQVTYIVATQLVVPSCLTSWFVDGFGTA